MDALLEAPARGTYWVRDALSTDGAITAEGDSGTVLSTGSDNRIAVGICVGDYHSHSIAESVGRVLELLIPKLGNLRVVPV
jgi:hypothetical protein